MSTKTQNKIGMSIILLMAATGLISPIVMFCPGWKRLAIEAAILSAWVSLFWIAFKMATKE